MLGALVASACLKGNVLLLLWIAASDTFMLRNGMQKTRVLLDLAS